jgi:hypothetical protein
MTNDLIGLLADKAKRLRIHSINATAEAGSGHPTSCMSAADVVAALFFHVMRYDPQNAKHPNNDRFILSKGHAAPLLYAGVWKKHDFFETIALAKMGGSLETSRRRGGWNVRVCGPGLSFGGRGGCAGLDNWTTAYVLIEMANNREACGKRSAAARTSSTIWLGCGCESTGTEPGHHAGHWRSLRKSSAFGWHRRHRWPQPGTNCRDLRGTEHSRPTAIIALTKKGGISLSKQGRLTLKEGLKALRAARMGGSTGTVRNHLLRPSQASETVTALGRRSAVLGARGWGCCSAKLGTAILP